mmetsp:Transcript_369/g.1462  ORF Transcript_369/g.1462 Transcript_369/m.1462 type:complete len:264 (+) Transcript_369:5914-6705(+)
MRRASCFERSTSAFWESICKLCLVKVAAAAAICCSFVRKLDSNSSSFVTFSLTSAFSEEISFPRATTRSASPRCRSRSLSSVETASRSCFKTLTSFWNRSVSFSAAALLFSATATDTSKSRLCRCTASASASKVTFNKFILAIASVAASSFADASLCVFSADSCFSSASRVRDSAFALATRADFLSASSDTFSSFKVAVCPAISERVASILQSSSFKRTSSASALATALRSSCSLATVFVSFCFHERSAANIALAAWPASPFS